MVGGKDNRANFEKNCNEIKQKFLEKEQVLKGTRKPVQPKAQFKMCSSIFFVMKGALNIVARDRNGQPLRVH